MSVLATTLLGKEDLFWDNGCSRRIQIEENTSFARCMPFYSYSYFILLKKINKLSLKKPILPSFFLEKALNVVQLFSNKKPNLACSLSVSLSLLFLKEYLFLLCHALNQSSGRINILDIPSQLIFLLSVLPWLMIAKGCLTPFQMALLVSLSAWIFWFCYH